MHPYTDIESRDNWVIREFTKDIDPIELLWHRDEEDRCIEVLHTTDWQIQLEDQLPLPILGKINIQKEQWHRLIKGTGSLILKIYKS
jgi:hypothetical protein